MDALIALLLDWIASNTDYDTRGMPHPAVVEVSPEKMTLEFYAGAPHLVPEDGVDDRLIALYAHVEGPHGTIYILAPTHAPGAGAFEDATENPAYREILLHELIHHVQWQTGGPRHWPCPGYGERDAYLLGGRYLREMNTPDPLPNRARLAFYYSHC